MNTEPTCNFCGKKSVVVHRLITADDVAICDVCVNASHKGKNKIFFQETSSSCSCSFCEKNTENVVFILSSFRTPKKSICNECLELCDEILEEEEKKKNTPNSVFDAKLRCSFCGKSEPDVLKLIAGPGVYICDGCAESANEVLSKELPLWSWKQELASRGSEGSENSTISRSIEFSPEHREAGTSILTYFSHVLKSKYPDISVKVTIEQDNLTLRMIIDTPTGQKEIIEKTLEEYGMVITGKMEPEIFLSDPFEIMALKNKLEIADLELRQMRKLMDFSQCNSQQRIESLEIQVSRFYNIVEKGLQSGNTVFGVINKMAEQDKATYDLKNAKFGGGFAAEGAL